MRSSLPRTCSLRAAPFGAANDHVGIEDSVGQTQIDQLLLQFTQLTVVRDRGIEIIFQPDTTLEDVFEFKVEARLLTLELC